MELPGLMFSTPKQLRRGAADLAVTATTGFCLAFTMVRDI